MKKKISFLFLFFSLFASCWLSCSQAFAWKDPTCYNDEIFTIDTDVLNLKKFWLKIFLDYNDGQTIIHDEQNPNIIYSIVDHENFEHFARVKKVKLEIKKIEKILSQIKSKNGKNLKENEKKIYDIIPENQRTYKEIKKLSLQVRYQQGMSNRFLDGLKRSMLYLDHIKVIFEELELPLELAFLPHVESSFNYKAYSKVGAAGIWQIMPSTGKHYDMKVENNIDERLDPLAATRVAARILRDYFKMVKSWPLAVTSYNNGPSNILKTIKKIGSNDFSAVMNEMIKRDTIHYASKNFYPSFLAAVEIASNPGNYYSETFIETPLSFLEYKLSKKMSIKQLLNVLELNLDQFKELNPQIRMVAFEKNITLPKGFLVKIPMNGPGYNREEVTALQKFRPFKKS